MKTTELKSLLIKYLTNFDADEATENDLKSIDKVYDLNNNQALSDKNFIMEPTNNCTSINNFVNLIKNIDSMKNEPSNLINQLEEKLIEQTQLFNQNILPKAFLNNELKPCSITKYNSSYAVFHSKNRYMQLFLGKLF